MSPAAKRPESESCNIPITCFRRGEKDKVKENTQPEDGYISWGKSEPFSMSLKEFEKGHRENGKREKFAANPSSLLFQCKVERGALKAGEDVLSEACLLRVAGEGEQAKKPEPARTREEIPVSLI